MFVDRRSLRPAHPVGVKCWVHLSPFLNRCYSTPTELAARRRSVLQTSNSSGVPSLLTWLEELGVGKVSKFESPTFQVRMLSVSAYKRVRATHVCESPNLPKMLKIKKACTGGPPWPPPNGSL